MMRYIKTVIKYSVVVYLCTNVITSFNKIFVRKVNSLTSIYIYIYINININIHTSHIHMYIHTYMCIYRYAKFRVFFDEI